MSAVVLAPVKERQFLFVTSSERPKFAVTCVHCGWSASRSRAGLSPFEQADQHDCPGVETHEALAARREASVGRAS